MHVQLRVILKIFVASKIDISLYKAAKCRTFLIVRHVFGIRVSVTILQRFLCRSALLNGSIAKALLSRLINSDPLSR